MPLPELDLDAFQGMPFPVAHRKELARKGVLPVEAMGRQLLVAWNDGAPRVFADQCAHLGLPLSMGKAKGGRLTCAYHGWSFRTDDGQVVEQPALQRPHPCALERFGCLTHGDLVFAWTGDAAADDIRAMLPPTLPQGISLHRVVYDCPFYLVLFNAVDYAHFSHHRLYGSAYSIYRRFRGDGHIPGTAFRSELVEETEHMVHLRIPEARRDLRLYASAAEASDEGGVNLFQTFVTPLGPRRTLYWECYHPQSRNRLVRAAARGVFHGLIAPLMDTEDQAWTSATAEALLEGRNIHLVQTDAALGAHLRKFVAPRLSTAEVS